MALRLSTAGTLTIWRDGETNDKLIGVYSAADEAEAAESP